MCAGIPHQNLQGNCKDPLNRIETNVEYFNNPTQSNTDSTVWYEWSEGDWNKDGGMTRGLTSGQTARQRYTRYPQDMPLKINSVHKDDHSLSWYHKRNFTLYLVNNRINGPYYFPGNSFTQGTINTKGDGTAPAVNTVNNAAWIMCAVSLRGQSRFRFTRGYNGWCWDGTSTEQTWQFANPSQNAGTATWRNVYFNCRIDFVGSTFNGRPGTKRSLPVGYFAGQPVYGKSGLLMRRKNILTLRIAGVAPAKDTKTITIDVSADQTLADMRQAFPMSYDE